jgi:hypothetical protein
MESLLFLSQLFTMVPLSEDTYQLMERPMSLVQQANTSLVSTLKSACPANQVPTAQQLQLDALMAKTVFAQQAISAKSQLLIIFRQISVMLAKFQSWALHTACYALMGISLLTTLPNVLHALQATTATPQALHLSPVYSQHFARVETL